VLELARERWGGAKMQRGTGTGARGVEEEEEEVEVVERKFTMGEVVEASEEGRLVEAFGCGTAFFIAPVADIHFRGKDIELPLKTGAEARYAMTMKTWLREIMYGVVEHEWGVVVDEEESSLI
jgi:branched-chain amino acid aminotransferase